MRSRKGQAITQGYTMPAIDTLVGLRAAHADSPAGRASILTTWERFKVQVALLTPHDPLHGNRLNGVELRIVVLAEADRAFTLRDANRLARQLKLTVRTPWKHDATQFSVIGLWAEESEATA